MTDEGAPAEAGAARAPAGGRAFRYGAAAALGVLGFGLNLLPVELSPGTDLIFGGVAYLLAAVALGPLPGLLAAAIASARTLWLWNHPFAWLIFSAEALVVGWVVHRWRLRPVLADLLYWLLSGVPLFFLTYYLTLEVTGTTAAVVLLKQAFNGLIDALAVEALLLLPAVRRLLGIERAPRLHFTLAAVVALAAVLPALLFGVLEGRQEWRRNVERAQERAALFADAYGNRLEQYIQLHERAVRTVARGAERRAEWDPQQLQRLLSVEQEQFPGFLNMYAADARAITVAFAPAAAAAGESLLGLDFSDRPYYRELRRTRRTVVSDVFAGRGGTTVPLVVIAEPVVLRDTLAGFVLGALDLSRFPEPTELGRSQRLRVADETGAVVFDSESRYQEGQPPRVVADSAVFAAVRAAGPGRATTYDPSAGGPAAAAVSAARRLAGVAFVPSMQWWVWVEQPFGEVQGDVARQYVRLFVLLAAGTLVALVVSGLLGQALARPLVRLQATAAALARGELGTRVGTLPAAVPAEIESLGRGFDEMADTLAQRDREMRELTLAAQTASRAKSDFIATMSHELRTPLNAVLGHLELLEMGLHGELNAEQRRAVQRVGVASRHLRGLIEEVLSFSRLEAGRTEVSSVPVDLCALAREVGTVIDPLAREKGLRFTVDCAEDATPWTTDPDKVRQILINLTGNAVKFTDQGEVHLGVETRDGSAIIRVRDTGPGISSEDQARLFRPFEQLQSGLSRAHGGTGLGLYLSRRYADLLGGRITVSSEPGQGSEFALILENGEE